jgi:ligand-binding SRPBCC domain-containing protein
MPTITELLMTYQFATCVHREQRIEGWLPDEIFRFFAEAGNLNRITPPWLSFGILGQSDVELRAGTLIHYRLAWYGIPLNWITRVEEWDPPRRFVDVQLSGPYRLWRHTHEFESCNSGTKINDTVNYVVPMGVLGRICAGWLVQRDVERIFDYRAKRISQIFAAQQ